MAKKLVLRLDDAIESLRPYPTKADNRAVFGCSGVSLLSGEKGYRIAHNYEIIDWDRLTELVGS
jgi:hypothetical protein